MLRNEYNADTVEIARLNALVDELKDRISNGPCEITQSGHSSLFEAFWSECYGCVLADLIKSLESVLIEANINKRIVSRSGNRCTKNHWVFVWNRRVNNPQHFGHFAHSGVLVAKKIDNKNNGPCPSIVVRRTRKAFLKPMHDFRIQRSARLHRRFLELASQIFLHAQSKWGNVRCRLSR